MEDIATCYRSPVAPRKAIAIHYLIYCLFVLHTLALKCQGSYIRFSMDHR